MADSLSRSGYAAEIMPEIVTGDEARGIALPIAAGKGERPGNHGRPPPGVKTGLQANYKVVTAKEAQENMTGRLKGKLPPIKGGISDKTAPAFATAPTDDYSTRASRNATAKVFRDKTFPPPELEPAPAVKSRRKAAKPVTETITSVEPNETPEQLKDIPVNNKDNFDPLGGEYEPGSPELQAEEKRMASVHAEERPVAEEVREAEAAAVEAYSSRAPAVPPRTTAASRLTVSTANWLAQRGRVSLTLADGTLSMAVIDVKECKYGVTIILPLSDEGSTFIPKPGSEITVNYKDRSWECFFPGTHFEVPEMKILGIVLVRKES